MVDQLIAGLESAFGKIKKQIAEFEHCGTDIVMEKPLLVAVATSTDERHQCFWMEAYAER